MITPMIARWPFSLCYLPPRLGAPTTQTARIQRQTPQFLRPAPLAQKYKLLLRIIFFCYILNNLNLTITPNPNLNLELRYVPNPNFHEEIW